MIHEIFLKTSLTDKTVVKNPTIGYETKILRVILELEFYNGMFYSALGFTRFAMSLNEIPTPSDMAAIWLDTPGVFLYDTPIYMLNDAMTQETGLLPNHKREVYYLEKLNVKSNEEGKITIAIRSDWACIAKFTIITDR